MTRRQQDYVNSRMVPEFGEDWLADRLGECAVVFMQIMEEALNRDSEVALLGSPTICNECASTLTFALPLVARAMCVPRPDSILLGD